MIIGPRDPIQLILDHLNGRCGCLDRAILSRVQDGRRYSIISITIKQHKEYSIELLSVCRKITSRQ